MLSITTRNGDRVANNDDSGGPDSYVRFLAPRDGEYVVTMVDHLKKGGPDYTYRVEISPVAPRLKLSTPNESPRRGTGTMAVAVPRGNRQAILINAARADFGGALSLSASGLPAGVAYEADTIGPGNDVVPVLFTAAPQAPVAATLAVVTGRPVDLKLDVPSEFCQVVITQNGEPVVHNLGTGRLRIDKPLPLARNAPTTAKTTVTSVASAPSAPSRPLSRLEKLRGESKARAKSSINGPS